LAGFLAGVFFFGVGLADATMAVEVALQPPAMYASISSAAFFTDFFEDMNLLLNSS